MRCTDAPSPRRPVHGARRTRALACLAALVLAGCAPTRPPLPTAPPLPQRPAPPSVAPPSLPAPARARHWDEYRWNAAQRLVAANPTLTYGGAVPDPLLAIPVLEVELNADGSVRRIKVLREPRQAKDTVQLAIDAVRRAAPFGEVAHLPRPWSFVEVFLFDDDRRFKPRTLER